MSSKIKTFASAGIGLIIIGVTLILFFGNINQQKETMDWLALTFALISELALFGTIIFFTTSTTKKTLINVSTITILFFYWLLTTSISIVKRIIFSDNIEAFALTQIIISAIAIIIIILIAVFANNVKKHDEKLLNARVMMDQCENLAYVLKSNTKFDDYSVLLNQIYEDLKYSDKTIHSDKEQDIYTEINNLFNLLSNETDKKSEDIAEKIDNIILLIKQRNISIKQLKQGGF